MERSMESMGARADGLGRWDWEAGRVILLAAELDIPVDKEALILYDIRDLMSLQLSLQTALQGAARRPLAPVSATIRRLRARVGGRSRPSGPSGL